MNDYARNLLRVLTYWIPATVLLPLYVLTSLGVKKNLKTLGKLMDEFHSVPLALLSDGRSECQVDLTELFAKNEELLYDNENSREWKYETIIPQKIGSNNPLARDLIFSTEEFNRTAANVVLMCLDLFR